MKNNITRAAVMLLLTFMASATAWADPDLVIRSAADWNTFADNVNNGTSYQGQTVVLAADISVTTMAGINTQPFDGTFDGCGHTLNLNLTNGGYYTAPFSKIQGATIKNLKTTGTVTGGMHCSGLVGIAFLTNLIQNCEVAASVICSGDTHTHCGGIVGHGGDSQTTIHDCLFSGSISGATTATGIIYGWANNGTHTLINCLAAGTYTNCGGLDIIQPRGTVNVSNCYKTQNVGNYGTYTTATGETLRALLGDGWEVSGNNVVPVMVNSFEVPNVSYFAYNTTTQTFETLTANVCRIVTSSTTTMGVANTETWYVVNNTVTVNSSRIEVLGTVNLILADGKTFRAEKGLHVPNGVTLNIYGQSSGTGKLFCATTEERLAGIGGNNEQTSGTITIHGGRIEAYGNYQSAAIGGGRAANGGTTTIYGGTINATGGTYGAGIGGGANGNGGTITIIGGTVIAQAGTVDGNDNSQAIGSGAFGSGGTLMLGDMKVYASSEATNPVTYANRLSTCHSKYARLVPCTDHNYVNGVCTYCGAVPNVPVNYLAYQTATHSFVEQTVSEPTLVDEFTTTMGADNTETWYAVRRGVSNSNRIEVRGTVHLILCDGKTMTASKGITVNNGNSLSIYAQSGGTGVLNATGYEAGGNIYECAAIGSTGRTSVGDITIHGGRITATGVAWTAGIGGGIGSGEGSITIYGGTINASGIYSEAIGHGGGNNIASVTRTLIDGLRVTVNNNSTPVPYGDRVSALGQYVARVEPCTEHHTTTDHCDYCGIACYGVTYDGNNATGGTVPAQNTAYLPGATVTVLGNTGNLERTGYIFAGWNTAANGSGTSYAAAATFAINSSVTLYAQWTPITYTVRFNKNHNDATGTMSDLTLTYDAAHALTANAFTRDGYAFTGWSTSPDGAVVYSDGQNVSNLATEQNAIVNLYAQWTEIYTIGYDLAGGSVATPNPTTYTALSNAITLVNPTREGYTFTGWTGTGLTEPTMTVTIPQGSTGNRTYTATWTEVYTITYDLAGGTVATPNPTTYTVLSDAISLVNPTRAGCYFAGWTGTGLTEATITVTIPTGSTGNRAYTATWDAISGEYLAYNTTTGAFETLSIPANTTSVTSSTTTMGTNNTETWYIVDDNVTVSERITVNGTVNLILVDGKTLTAVGGINVRAASTVRLNIYGQSEGTGELRAYTLGNGPASIGGNSSYAGGTITIHGGIITAKTCSYSTNEFYAYGAGIGGGYYKDGGTVTIHGGTVNAYGGAGAAGIGGGGYWGNTTTATAGNGGTITITGGTVTAIGSNRTSNNNQIIGIGGAGIGGGGVYSNSLTYVNGTGGGGAGGTITISGGTVTAIGAKGAAGIGGGNKPSGAGGTITIIGGTVKATAGEQNVTSLTTSAQAIGRGEAASDEGTLMLGNMKVYVSDEAMTPVALADRESTCRSSYAKLTHCTEHNFVNNVCTHCGATTVHITYDSNGATDGTVPTDATDYITSQMVTVLGNTGNLEHTGYTFGGWNTQSDGLGTNYVPDETFIIFHSLTLYAKWIPINYTISYNLDGGSVATANPTTYTIESESITLNNPTKEGYDFAGWTGSNGDTPQTMVTIAAGSTGDKSYTANWTPITYTITYYGLAGATFASANPTTYTIESSDITLCNPTKEGYSFYGWTGGLDSEIQNSNFEVQNSTLVVISTGSYGNRSYTASWKSALTLSSVADNNATITANNGETFECLFLDGYTLYHNGSWNTLCVPFNLNSFADTPLEGAVVKSLASSTYDNGVLSLTMTDTLTSIEAGKPYIVKWDADLVIHTAAEWNAFASNVNNGTETYEGKTVKLANDITVSTMVGSGSSSNYGAAKKFRGTFDGCGHTLTVNITANSDGTAPFRFVDGATFKNLIISGSVTNNSAGKETAGMIAYVCGATTISNCVVSASVTCKRSGDCANGGFIARIQGGVVTIDNCLFNGKLLGSSHSSGGFVGWRNANNTPLTFNNCLFAPSQITMGISNSCTFNRASNSSSVRNNCYYTTAYGSAQGTQTSATGNALQALLGDGWEVRDGNVVPIMQNTVTDMENPVFNDIVISIATANVTTEHVEFIGSYAPFSDGLLMDSNNPDGDALHAAIDIDNSFDEGYTFNGWYTNAGLTGAATTIPFAADGNVTLYAMRTPINYTISYNGLEGASLASSNPTSYTIESDAITLINPTKEGYTFIGWTGSNGDTPETTVTIAAGSIGDKSYTANWTVNTYTITFVNWDGTELQSSQITYGETPVYTGITPTRAANTQYTYTFNGWSPVITTVTGDATYTAQFTQSPIAYTITYNGMEGATLASPNPTGYTFESEAITLNNPTKEGYTFTGWTGTDLIEPTMTVTIATGSTGDRSYTANWTINTYTISFVNWDGTVLQSGLIAYSEIPVYTGATPTREATAQYTYTFISWSPDIAAVTGNATYTAQYSETVNEYTITFVNWNGTELQSGLVAYGETPAYTGATPTKEATAQYTYTFSEWSPEIVTVTDNATYTAQFTESPIAYTIAYYGLEGATLASPNPTTYNVLSANITLNNPTKIGHTFAGWTGTDLTEPTMTVTIASGSTGDRSYTANWTVNTYTITFVNWNGTALQSSQVAYGEMPVYTGATPTREATAQYTYTFIGWSPDIAAVTGDATYTAQYSETVNEYTITFVNWDGTTLQSGLVAYGETPAYTGATPTKEATAQYTYTFSGWSPEIVTVTDNATYTAQFTESPIDYTIAYYGLEGATLASPNPTTYNALSGNITLNNPTKIGHTFAGWTGTDLSGPTMTVTIALGSTGDRSYTANWTANTYTITFVNWNGTALQSSQVAYGETPVYTGPTPTKEGSAQYSYTFSGWSPEIVAVTGEATYTAQFTETINTYTITFVNWDGTELQNGLVAYGEMPAYTGETPTKEATPQYSYSFSGWSPEIATVTGNATYTAQFTEYPTIYYRAYNTTAQQFETLVAPIYSVVTSSTTNISNGWYVMSSNVTISTRINVTGTVNLILCDGYTLTSTKGLHVPNGVTLNIYGQSAGSGKIAVSNSKVDSYQAGIGGNDNEIGGSVAIHGGNISTTGGLYAAGIGGGRSKAGGTVVIYGGTVGAYGGYYAAGIGGGNGGSGGNSVVITGGTVTTTGGSYGASIGGGRYGAGCNSVIITGGTVKVQSENVAQAIGRGGGSAASGGLTLGDMKVFASANATTPVAPENRESTCRSSYARLTPCTEHHWMENTCTLCGAINHGIAYSANGATSGMVPVDITEYTTGATVTVLDNTGNLERTGYSFAGWNTAADGSGTPYTVGDTFPFSIPLILYAQWTPITYTITYDLDGGSLTTTYNSYTIESAAFTLDQPTKEGYFFTGWTGSNGSTPQTSVTIASGTTGNLSYTANWHELQAPIEYRAYNVTTQEFENLNTSAYIFVSSSTTTMSDCWYVVNNDIDMGSSRINVIGTVNLILCDGASLTVPKGFCVPSGVTLNIYSQTNGTGTLTISSVDNNQAGIGGNDNQGGGSVSIHGGIVTTTGGTYAAGIGGGRYKAGGTFAIYGGSVVANGGACGAGIGGGWDAGNGCSSVIISGGVVTATGGNWAAGIGGGQKGNGGGSIVITGGTVNVTGGYNSAGIGGGYQNAGCSSVDISGGIVTVSCGDGSQAIGYGSSGSSQGSGGLTLGESIVFASEDALYPVTLDSRISTCRSTYARIEPCTEHNWIDNVCDWCGAINYGVAYGRNHATGGHVPVDATEYTDGETVTVLGNIGNLERTGFTFVGWNATADGNGTDYTAGSTFIYNSPVTIYAKWTMDTYSISYDLAGGTLAEANPTSYNVESPDITLNNPTREGYAFGGWTGTGLAAPSITVTIATGSAGNREYTAVWLPILEYRAYNTTIEAFETRTVDEYLSITSLTVITNGWYAVTSDVTVSDIIEISGTLNLILCDGATLTASQGFTLADGATINIYGQSSGTGTLTIGDNAQIGGYYNGAITIHGGNITMDGTNPADDYFTGIETGSFTIYDGSVTMEVGNDNIEQCFGIMVYNALLINGGNINITVTSYEFSNGIVGEGCDVIINGGNVNVTAVGTGSYGIVANGGCCIINGGNVIVNATANSQAYALLAMYDGITVNGGNIRATATGDESYGFLTYGGDITLGWTNANDRIYASNYSFWGNNTLNVKSGQSFWNGSETVSGTISDFSLVNGKTLQPFITHLHVDGYGDGNDKWVFIASPVEGSITPTSVTSLIGNQIQENPPLYDYDLYRFNQSVAMEWENYHQHNDFMLVNGQGYLYANKYDVNLYFPGEMNMNKELTVDLTYDANAPHASSRGWNLVGNPFPVLTWVNRSYYTMNDEGTGLVAQSVSASTPIAPCIGVMVKATATGETVTFGTSAPNQQTENGYGNLNIALTQANTRSHALLDNAIVSFNHGDQLEKYYFGEQKANIFIPQNHEDYAIAFGDRFGVTPLNFEAHVNGEYTISVNPVGVEMNYLHLIDNLTGADIDLLVQPSYSFEGRISHYPSRFKLVYCAQQNGEENDDDDFAFIYNGDIFIAGDGIVQVIDMMGRIIVCRDATHCVSTTGITPGVYVLRLVDGEKVKTQKIVIK